LYYTATVKCNISCHYDERVGGGY